MFSSTFIYFYIYFWEYVCLSVFDSLRPCELYVAHQASLSMVYGQWNFHFHGIFHGCRFLLQEIFPTQGSNPCLMSPVLAGEFFTTNATWGDNCFTLLHWFLPYVNMNQPQVYTHVSSLLNLPPTFHSMPPL